MNFCNLESERLYYRGFRENDFDLIYDMYNNDINMKYRFRDPMTREETKTILQWYIQCSMCIPCVNFRYAVVLKDTDVVIGTCELAFTDRDPAEITWELHRNYWNQGYGTEMGKKMLELGFEILELRRIVAFCNSSNIASVRIMEKLGMRREALFVKCSKGNRILNYEWCDKYLYAILRDEYEVTKI